MDAIQTPKLGEPSSATLSSEKEEKSVKKTKKASKGPKKTKPKKSAARPKRTKKVKRTPKKPKVSKDVQAKRLEAGRKAALTRKVNREKAKAEPAVIKETAPKTVRPKKAERTVRKLLVESVVEIGFSRTQQILDDIKHAAMVA